MMKRFRLGAACLLIAACGISNGPAGADPLPPSLPSPPFTATLSNNVPLVFGMDPASAANSLQTPLTYVSGRPGSEIYLALREVGGSGFFDRRDRLYLQFRHGRLTGWKGDWGRNWMWR
jgi:hypothetical protein